MANLSRVTRDLDISLSSEPHLKSSASLNDASIIALQISFPQQWFANSGVTSHPGTGTLWYLVTVTLITSPHMVLTLPVRMVLVIKGMEHDIDVVLHQEITRIQVRVIDMGNALLASPSPLILN